MLQPYSTQAVDRVQPQELTVGNLFTIAAHNNTPAYFTELVDREEAPTLNNELSFRQNDALFYVNFRNNRLITSLGKGNFEVKLSVALRVTRDLQEIFDEIRQQSTQTPQLADRFIRAITFQDQQEQIFSINGQERIAFFPDRGRVRLTTSRGPAAMPLEMIQACGLLFSRAYAESINPALGIQPTASLIDALHMLYLGRGVLRLAAVYDGEGATYRELQRLLSLAVAPGSQMYSILR